MDRDAITSRYPLSNLDRRALREPALARRNWTKVVVKKLLTHYTSYNSYFIVKIDARESAITGGLQLEHF